MKTIDEWADEIISFQSRESAKRIAREILRQGYSEAIDVMDHCFYEPQFGGDEPRDQVVRREILAARDSKYPCQPSS